MTRHRHGRDRSAVALWAAVGVLGAGVAALAYARSARDDRHRPADSAPGRTARRGRFGDYAVTGKTITIHRTRQEIYDFWRDFANLARVMDNIVSVTPLGDGVDRWTIGAPGGTQVSTDTRIVEDRPGELISWRSVEGSEIETEGKVMFRDAPADRGTVVEAIVAYKPPAGNVGRLIAKLFGKEPKVQARQDLKRLKMLMETGEIATSANRKAA